MHPANCRCRTCGDSRPLTLDETVQLAVFLAERGQREALLPVLGMAAEKLTATAIRDGWLAEIQGGKPA